MCIDLRKTSRGAQTSNENGAWQEIHRVNVLEYLYKYVLSMYCAILVFVTY